MCWRWRGSTAWNGYGVVGFQGRQQKAHRVAWQLTRGPIPQGMRVLHRCDNPSCCNPDHLFLGTQLDNIADREAKGRGAKPPSRRKLTRDEVAEMRRLYAALPISQAQLAEQFGVSRGNVSKIVNGKSYQEVGT